MKKQLKNKMHKSIIAILVFCLLIPYMSIVSFAESTETETIAIESLPIYNSDRYTGNEGDSFINKISTRNSNQGITGEIYEKGLEVWIARWNGTPEQSWAWCEYILEGYGISFSGTIDVAVDSYNTDTYNSTIQIIGDGSVLFEQQLTSDVEYPINFDVNVQNVQTLRIYAFDNVESEGGTSFLLGNASLSCHKGALDAIGNQKINAILGVYEGGYTAPQGITGLKLAIYKKSDLLSDPLLLKAYATIATNCCKDENGNPKTVFTEEDARGFVAEHPDNYIAVFNYFPIVDEEGNAPNPDVEEGMYSMTVTYNDETSTYEFKGHRWIQHDTYEFANLCNVTIDGDSLHGDVYGKTEYGDVGDVLVTKNQSNVGYRIDFVTDSLSVGIDKNHTLEAVVTNNQGLPAAQKTPIRWFSADESIATVKGANWGDDGFEYARATVCGISEGETIIYAELDNKRIASCKISVSYSGGGLDTSGTPAVSLEDLTSVDYLAFSHFAYTDLRGIYTGTTKYFDKDGNQLPQFETDNAVEAFYNYDRATGSTIRYIFGGYRWDANWKDTEIKNSELFSHIADWQVLCARENFETGFAAYTFTNGTEYVVAYRGSDFFNDLGDTYNDWAVNDIPMFLGKDGTQISDALYYAEDTVAKYGKDNVRFTGHSLGGALCDIAAASQDCYAQSFNAAPFLSIAYHYHPEEMGKLFSGVDNWKFTDHVTNGDIIVGKRGLGIKNFEIHATLDGYFHFAAHGLDSMVTKVNGKLELTEVIDYSKIESTTVDNLSNYFGSSTTNVVYGTSTEDNTGTYNNLITSIKALSYDFFMGDGDDIAATFIHKGSFVGGRGNDLLCGSAYDDSYYYFKGDGIDKIVDTAGDDTLYLIGFKKSDRITAFSDLDHIIIRCNGEDIVQINKTRSFFSGSFTVMLEGIGELDIIDYFDEASFAKFAVIACPVDVEIIDGATGNVVYTLRNIEEDVGIHNTDYGYFCVLPDGEGNYVKKVDLYEGYSLRIVGAGEGTMDVTVFEPRDGKMVAAQATNIPVTESLTATFTSDTNGMSGLSIDSDGDGIADQQLAMTYEYTITYVSGEENGENISENVALGTDVTLPECTFTAPDGKHFSAWSIDGVEHKVGDTYIPNSDTTVTALWQEHTEENGICSDCGAVLSNSSDETDTDTETDADTETDTDIESDADIDTDVDTEKDNDVNINNGKDTNSSNEESTPLNKILYIIVPTFIIAAIVTIVIILRKKKH